jgi:hypothetical protein
VRRRTGHRLFVREKNRDMHERAPAMHGGMIAANRCPDARGFRTFLARKNIFPGRPLVFFGPIVSIGVTSDDPSG